MVKLKQSIYERAMSRSWPRMMTFDDLAEFTGWTSQTLTGWYREGRIRYVRKSRSGAKNFLFIPRELVFAQFGPGNEEDE
ncbi:hypothetical protein ACUH95_06360 [Dermabacteraceae bacterium P13101]